MSEYFEEYFRVTKENKISESAKNYRKQQYPISMLNISKSKFMAFLGGCFTVGYFIRQTELIYSHVFDYDVKKIKHNKATNKILKEDISVQEKIIKIAEYKENNNDSIGLGPEVVDYSVISVDETNQLFGMVVTDYLNQNVKLISELDISDDDALELSGRNAVLGYCLRLAEEIVETEIGINEKGV